jgi:hypothetical protein
MTIAEDTSVVIEAEIASEKRHAHRRKVSSRWLLLPLFDTHDGDRRDAGSRIKRRTRKVTKG